MSNGTEAAKKQALIEEARQAARVAGLRYVHDGLPGIRRQRAGDGFLYLDPDGKRVRDTETLARIKALAIPPAWENVWICAAANGHIQAVGRDARGRKQYRYHNSWRAVRDANKYERLLDFARQLPRLRRVTNRHLAQRGLSRDKVLAAVVQIMEKTLIRVGNEEYARTNGSYGLTTIRNGHARVKGAKVVFEFRGKSGVNHRIDLHDARLARIVRTCQELPQQELFSYYDDTGTVCNITSTDVNDYLRQITGEDVSAKDFRTWAGTVLAAQALRAEETCESKTAAQRIVKAAIAEVATRLGNTVAVCRKCYVHPEVIAAYLDGSLDSCLSQVKTLPRGGLPREEAAVLCLLQTRLKRKT